jgi:GTP-binding protein
MKKKFVAVVGRPNVGKSTLFNKIIGNRTAIVEDTPGVTRDRIIADAEWQNHHFSLIDTGGIEPYSKDIILAQMRRQAQLAMDMADVIIFMVDGREGITANDIEVATMIRKSKKKIILAVNKIDTLELEENIYEFYNLGLGEPTVISAEQALGIGDLLDTIVHNLESVADVEEQQNDAIQIAVVGKPNVGKSTLINKLVGEDRLIVSNIPGTTRDAVDTDVTYHGKSYTFIDTAGLRRKNKIYDNIERYSIIRSVAAVERADIVLFLIDGTEKEIISEQDTKIAGIAHNRNKASIIVVNKWDAVEKETKTPKKFEKKIRDKMAFMQYAPIIYISAATGQKTHKIYETIEMVTEQYSRRIPTGQLNEMLGEAVLMKQPPSKSGRRLKIFYITQVSTKPPTFVLFVNDEKLMHFSYERYISNYIREAFGLDSTPIHFIIRKREKDKSTIGGK